MRITEVHRYAGLLAKLFVHGQLPTLVVRHAQMHRLRNAQELVGEGLRTLAALAGLNAGNLTSKTKRLVRSTPGFPPHWHCLLP